VRSLEEVDKMLDEAADEFAANRKKSLKIQELEKQKTLIEQEIESLSKSCWATHRNTWEEPFWRLVIDRAKVKLKAEGIKWEDGL
jgi:hypothetical protein